MDTVLHGADEVIDSPTNPGVEETCCNGSNSCSMQSCSGSSNCSSEEYQETLPNTPSPCPASLGTPEPPHGPSAFDATIADVLKRMTGAEISTSTVATLLKYAMEAVEASELKGSEQKELAVKVVKEILVRAEISDDARAICLSIVDSGVLSDMVDLVVDATKGRLEINQAKKKVRKCLLGCMGR